MLSKQRSRQKRSRLRYALVGTALQQLSSPACSGLNHIEAPVNRVLCYCFAVLLTPALRLLHSLQSRSVLQVKAEPVVQATAQDNCVKAEAGQHQHEEDDDTGSEGDSDEDEDYEVSVSNCGQAACKAQCTPAAVYSWHFNKNCKDMLYTSMAATCPAFPAKAV